MLFAARIAPFKGRCDSIVCVLICFFFPLILFLSVAAFLATMHTVRCYKQIYFVCTTTLNVGNHYSTKWNQQFSNYGTHYGRGPIPHSILHPITLLCTGLVRLSLSARFHSCSQLFPISHSFYIEYRESHVPLLPSVVVVCIVNCCSCCCCCHCEFFNYELGPHTHTHTHTNIYRFLFHFKLNSETM